MNTIYEYAEIFFIITCGFIIVAVLLSCYVRSFRRMCGHPKRSKQQRRLSYPMDSVTNITLISCQETDSDLLVNCAKKIITDKL